MMKIIFVVLNAFFCSYMIYCIFLALAGLFSKIKRSKIKKYDVYPSVDIFIPAHNEGIVIADTLTAMVNLEYPGELNIYLLNDNSTDETKEIGEIFDEKFSRVHHIEVPPGTPKGKSRVLNYGLSISNGELFVVYDADNQPESDAIERLVAALRETKNGVGAVGTVRTVNAETNLLTRMIAAEFQVFQLVLQVGRWCIHQIGSLPGTNMLLKREIIEDMGGYDEYALAEDAELTVRLASQNKVIAVDPLAITWEQEPETMKVLLKQRTRWLQGNLYLMLKFFRTPSLWKGPAFIHLFHYVTIYLLFPTFLLISNALFICGIFGWISIEINLPFLFLWFMSYYLYTMQIILIQWFDNTLTFKNLCVAVIMYFTYAQLFIFLIFKAIVEMVRQQRNKEVHWEKTVRVKNPTQ